MPLLDRIGATWKDAGRDVVLIVVSILIAFAVDAWWSGIQERQADAVQATALRSEMESGKASLDFNLEAVQVSLAATVATLEMMGEGAPPPPSDSLLLLLRTSFNVGYAPLRTTVVQDVLSGSNPSIARDPDLTRQLDEWLFWTSDLEVDFGHLERNRDEDLQSAMVEAGFPGMGGIALEFLGLESGDFPLQTHALVRSPEVYAGMAYRAFRMAMLQEGLTVMTALTDSIVVSLNEVGR